MSPDLSLPVSPEREAPMQPQEKGREFRVPVERQKEVEKPQEAVQREHFPQAAPPPVLPQIPTVAEKQAADSPEQQELKKVELILEEHVQELFLRLPENKRLAFKQKGEETAKKITALLHEATVKVQKIINLIMSWLRLAPDVSKFYIEQEAVEKANRLLALKDQEHPKV